jgi:ferric-chelate reductase
MIIPLLVVVIAAALLTHVEALQLSAHGACCLYARPACGQAALWKAIGSFALLTWGEWVVVITYIVSLIIYLIVASIQYAGASRSFSFVVGQLSAIHLGLAVLPVNRNSLLLWVCGLPFERAIKWHRALAALASVFILLHFVLVANTFSSSLVTLTGTSSTNTGWGNVYGFATGWIVLTMSMLAFEPIRRNWFELFYYPHQLFIAVMILSWLHSTLAFYIGIGPFALHMIDRMLRWRRSYFSATLQSTRVLEAAGDARVTQLSIVVPDFRHDAGDYVFLQLPEVSMMEWHPFTVSSDPNRSDGMITIHMAAGVAGSFTARAAELATTQALTSAVVEGPYGRISLPRWKFDYGRIVFVCGGIGTIRVSAISFGNNELDSLFYVDSICQVAPRSCRWQWMCCTRSRLGAWRTWQQCTFFG